MSYRFYTQPPPWVERVDAAVTLWEDGRHRPGPDPADGRLFLRKKVLAAESIYKYGEVGLRRVVQVAEAHFEMLREEGIFVPGGREYYAPDRTGSILMTQCATIEGVNLDWERKGPARPKIELEVAQEHCIEAVTAYYDRVEKEGHEWMLDDIRGLIQFRLGHTIYDYAGRPPKIYLADIDPTMEKVTPTTLAIARHQIGEI